MDIDKIKFTGVGADGRECKIPSRIFDRIDAERCNSLVYFDGDATVVLDNKGNRILASKGTVLVNVKRIMVAPDGSNAIFSVTPGKPASPMFDLPEDIQNRRMVVDYLTSFNRTNMSDMVCKHLIGVKFHRSTSTALDDFYGFSALMDAVKMIEATGTAWRLPEMADVNHGWRLLAEKFEWLNSTPQDGISPTDKNNMGAIPAILNGQKSMSNFLPYLRVDLAVDLPLYRECLKAMIESGADINSIRHYSCHGYSNLSNMVSRFCGLHDPECEMADTHLEVIKVLVEMGARTDAPMPYRSGRIIDEFAKEHGDQRLIAALKLDAPKPAAKPKKRGM